MRSSILIASATFNVTEAINVLSDKELSAYAATYASGGGAMSWYKLHNEIIHDPKIRALAFEDRWHFVALMCLTNDGTLDEPTELRDQLVEVTLGIHGPDLSNLKNRLQKVRLIDGDWRPLAWEKRQAPKDATSAERKRRWRDRQKAEKQGAATNEINGTRSGTETERTEVRSKKKECVSRKNSRGVNIPFEDYWTIFPKKIGKAKAKQRWNNLTNQDRESAMLFLRKLPYARREREFIPQGDTFINKRPWEDEDAIDQQTHMVGGEYAV